MTVQTAERTTRQGPGAFPSEATRRLRRRLLLAVAAAALVPTLAQAAAPSVERPVSGVARSSATAATAQPEILGVSQAASAADCTPWTTAACASTVPTLSANGTSGSCANGTFIECCPTQAPTCGTLLSSVYQQVYNASVDAGTGSSFTVPAAMPSGNTSVNGLGFAAAPTTSLVAGTYSTVLGNQAATFTTPSYTGSSAAATSQILGNARGNYTTTWEFPRFTGGAINSCDEYVWQKWADYAQWEDAARAGLNDPVYELTSPLQPFLNPFLRSDGQNISVNGTPWSFKYTIGDQIPRNAFISFVPTWLSTTDPTQSAILASIQNEQAHPFILGTSSSQPGYDQNDVLWVEACGTDLPGCQSMAGPFPWFTPSVVTTCGPPSSGGGSKDPQLKPLLVTCSKSTQFFPMTTQQDLADNEAFNAEQARLDAYTALLAELGDLYVSQASLTHELALFSAPSTAAVSYPAINAPLLTAAAPPSSSQPTPTFASYYFPHSLARRAAAVSYATQATALPLPAYTAPLASSPLKSTFTSLQLQLLNVQQAIASVQQQMTQALENEWNAPSKGCLLGLEDGQYANSCDWSPKSFIQQYVGLFEAQRQAAYARCLADTGDAFPLQMNPNINPGTPFANTALDTSAQWTDSLQDFENFMGEYEVRDLLNYIYLKDESSVENTFINETTQLPVTSPATTNSGVTSATVGQQAGDTHSFGGSYFGAKAQYSAEWTATAKLQTASQAQGEGLGHYLINEIDESTQATLEGTVTVFGSTQTLINANVGLTAQPGSATYTAVVTALGNDILPTTSGTLTSTPTVIYNLTDPVGSLGFSTIIPILCVPVKVSAGVALTAGVNVTANASPSTATGPTNLTSSLTGTVAPFAKLDANASVGVDLVVISVGIEGTITLIDATVPITGTVSVGEQGGTGPFMLNSSITGNLQLNELAGEVDLYAELNLGIWSDTAKVYLASWNGFHQEIPMFNPITASWPIDAINYRLFNQVNNADIGN